MAKTARHTIGVIADTHNRFLPRVKELFQGVDEIWHLGDVCEETVLDELRLLCPKLTVVLGNNDASLRYPLTLHLTRNEERFYLVHIPPRKMPEQADWLLFGHTHRPVDHVENGVHLFNPGSAGKANKGAPLSLGFLTREPGETFQSRLVLL